MHAIMAIIRSAAVTLMCEISSIGTLLGYLGNHVLIIRDFNCITNKKNFKREKLC